MERKLVVSKIVGILFTILLGTLLHFVYEWSNYNLIVAFFAPVNESVWEHLKLLFFPTLLYSLIEYQYYGKYYANYIPSITLGLIAGLLSIVVLYYTYSGILGHNVLVIDILIFMISVIITQYISYYILKNQLFLDVSNANSLLVLIGITLIFFMFTYKPPMCELFKDPIYHTYGINSMKK